MVKVTTHTPTCTSQYEINVCVCVCVLFVCLERLLSMRMIKNTDFKAAVKWKLSRVTTIHSERPQESWPTSWCNLSQWHPPSLLSFSATVAINKCRWPQKGSKVNFCVCVFFYPWWHCSDSKINKDQQESTPLSAWHSYPCLAPTLICFSSSRHLHRFWTDRERPQKMCMKVNAIKWFLSIVEISLTLMLTCCSTP